MNALVGALIGGGLDLLGGMQTNAANREIASDNRQFQKNMSNTAYRRSMRDMKKAGLNPILAYQQGGASTPAGSVIPMENPAKNMPAHVGNYQQGKAIKAQIDNLNTQSALNVAKIATEGTNQAANTASAGYTNALTGKTGQETTNLGITENLLNYETQMKANQLSVAQAEAVYADLMKSINMGTLGKTLAWMDRLGIKATDLFSLLGRRLGSAKMQPLLNGAKGNNPTAPTAAPTKPAPATDYETLLESYG